jgi:hypothetical protein
MKNDRHKDAIPAATLKQVHDQIEAAKTALAPYTLALTPQERHAMLKMGDKSLVLYRRFSFKFSPNRPSTGPAIHAIP